MTFARRQMREAGVSLPELLVVVALLALAILITVPIVSERLFQARGNAAANQYAVTLRAARMVAVTGSQVVQVQMDTATGEYTYTDLSGRTRRAQFPAGTTVRSSDPVSFRPDGGLVGDFNASTILEFGQVGERYLEFEVSVNRAGHVRVKPL